MMAKILTTLSLFCISYLVYGQAYQPLVVEQAHWKVCQTSTEDVWPCGSIFEYFLSGDTLVDNVAYKKLYTRSFIPNGSAGGGEEAYDIPFRIQTESMAGLIREDISGRKVYWRQLVVEACEHAQTEEVLLYDFALSVGDTLEGCTLFENPPVVIDSIMVENIYGTERRVYHLSEGIDLIEGIGYETGLLSVPVVPISTISTTLFEYCTGSDMDCNVAIRKGMVNPYQEWHIQESITDFVHGASTSITYEYRFEDTVHIDNRVYFELQERQQVTQPNWQNTGYFFRQDGNQVFRYPAYSMWDEEVLLYDFSLEEPGEMFFLQTIVYGDLDMELLEADTITLINGETRKRLFWNHDWDSWYWIEGIGANDHPFFPERSFADEIDGDRRKTQCFYKEDDPLNPEWQNEVYDDCYSYIVDTKEYITTSIRVFPNPVQDYLHIEGLNAGDVFTVYNAAGKYMQSVIGVAGNIVYIDLHPIPAGFYTYTIYHQEGCLRHSGKLVKGQ